METLKKQILFTENNCNACNRCIYTCPMPGANYSHTVEGNIIISVDNSKCISCGQCIDNCKIGARQYMDDTEAFFESLEKGEKISLLIDPSILLVYGAKTYNLFGYLKERGVDKIYDVSIGG
ncbi:MAG: 4Fe-4S binding protein, partial [Bacillota bacterium]|nr:4Fe-4S binding protein [Bacillota bacterium]